LIDALPGFYFATQKMDSEGEKREGEDENGEKEVDANEGEESNVSFFLDKSAIPSVPLGELFAGVREDDLMNLQQLGVETFDTYAICTHKGLI
jgi:hypothetical protein